MAVFAADEQSAEPVDTLRWVHLAESVLDAQGIRDDYIVMVGGAPLNEEFGVFVGADAYCRDAAVAAETATALVKKRRAAAA